MRRRSSSHDMAGDRGRGRGGAHTVADHAPYHTLGRVRLSIARPGPPCLTAPGAPTTLGLAGRGGRGAPPPPPGRPRPGTITKGTPMLRRAYLALAAAACLAAG